MIDPLAAAHKVIQALTSERLWSRRQVLADRAMVLICRRALREAGRAGAAELTIEEKVALVNRIRAMQKRSLHNDSADLIREDRDGR